MWEALEKRTHHVRARSEVRAPYRKLPEEVISQRVMVYRIEAYKKGLYRTKRTLTFDERQRLSSRCWHCTHVACRGFRIGGLACACLCHTSQPRLGPTDA